MRSVFAVRANRFIPAGAGNTVIDFPSESNLSVHPRRRGEHFLSSGTSGEGFGSSPQARGTPRTRKSWLGSARFIPAGAGNTVVPFAAAWARSVHPRRRGEHSSIPVNFSQVIGSSPQARGTLPRFPSCAGHGRFIPAGAGNTSGVVPKWRADPVHPRRRGEHQMQQLPGRHRCGSSPQARGTHDVRSVEPRPARFIPAGAGNTQKAI